MSEKAMDLADMLKAGCMPADFFDPRYVEPVNNVVSFDRARGARSSMFGRGDHVELAEALVEDLAPEGELVFTEGALWRYNADSARWVHLPDAETSMAVQAYAGAAVPNAKGEPKPLKIKANDVQGVVKLAQARVSDPAFFDGRSAAVAFSNGVVHLDGNTLTLAPPSPALGARGGFDFAYDPDAKPERFLAFLDGIFRDDADRVERIAFVQEFFGACVLGVAPRLEKCLVGIGGGSNGKSALATVMQGCMPPGSVSAVAPQDMAGEYNRASLRGMHLNVVEEMPEREIMDSVALKAIVTGGFVRARIIREAPFDFHPIAGHYFAANALPATSDQTLGFWRRFVVLTFNRNFEGDPARNARLPQELLAAEKPQMVSWLLQGLQRAAQAGWRYTYVPSRDAALAEWRKDSDQVALFVGEMTAQPTTAGVGEMGTKLYSAYVTWADRNGHKRMASNKFAARLKHLGLSPRHTEYGNRWPLLLVDVSQTTRPDYAG